MDRNKRTPGKPVQTGRAAAPARRSSGTVRKRQGGTHVPEARGAGARGAGARSAGARSAATRKERSVISSGDTAADGRVRLQKFLANSGVDSRRNCEEYIRTGRVTVNSEVITDPARGIDPEADEVKLDSERLVMPRFRYFLLNKPVGVLCTNRDPQGRPRAIDLIPVDSERLFTVGRLDENTRGLLLLTNDGQLAQRMAHPRFEVVRRYRCHVSGRPDAEILRQLREGMYFSDGFFRFRGVRVVRFQGRSTVLELELREGRNREIRRLLARVGHKVIELERIAFGPVTLGRLSPGEFRELRPAEVLAIRQFLETGQVPDSVKPRSTASRSGKPARRRPAIGSRGQNGPKRGAARPGRRGAATAGKAGVRDKSAASRGRGNARR
jgi:23S rRNA pseudouridine2605 synthase